MREQQVGSKCISPPFPFAEFFLFFIGWPIKGDRDGVVVIEECMAEFVRNRKVLSEITLQVINQNARSEVVVTQHDPGNAGVVQFPPEDMAG